TTTRILRLRRLRGAPQIPARCRAIRPPSRAAPLQIGARRQLALLEGDREPLADAIVVRGQDVRAAEAEDQEHLHRPPADPTHLCQAFDDSRVLHAMDLGERGELPVGGPAREVAQREELRAREAGPAELRVRDAQELPGRGPFVRARKERTQTREDRRRSLAGELLVDYRLRERAEEAGRLPELHAKGADGVDDARERPVGRTQVLDRDPGIEAERAVAGEEGRAVRRRALDREEPKLRGDAPIGREAADLATG